ncbi:PREDICTED: E3 ubiquitin-protein ligase KCMF1 isoform X3 [Papilio xuthus]|uniref:RING-type E3 ubiquitin transferase n=1 Tax=Papilio xuthus TaxID=66420 RepID=A0AAJ6Z5U6_PAPXU|nr:PREDICTED: E3 ubiquitin-protein ligase KCMF1 isoform X3 [Papilio xuthus]
MNRHEGVSCDSCLKNNFRGRRYKCLICIDYDLCAVCYESGAVTNQHTTEHPMQCILTRSDFDLYYAGESQALEQPQAYTCPFCNRMGFTDTALMEHVTAEHADTTLAVVCPVCASLSGGEPNFVTDDFAGHLTLEHRTGPRDLISFLDEPSGIRHGGVRRMPASGRGVSRARRTNMQFSDWHVVRSTGGGISSLSPSSRDAVVDPIAELLSQLSGVRRGAGQPGTPSQLQQLQMQLQLERQQATLERLPRRAATSSSSAAAPPPAAQPAAPPPQPDVSEYTFLLSGFLDATSSASNEEAESRAALLRGLMLASLGRAPPAPPPAQPAPPAQPVPPAPPSQPAPPAQPTQLAQPAQPPPRTKPQPRTKEAAARAHPGARQLPEGR